MNQLIKHNKAAILIFVLIQELCKNDEIFYLGAFTAFNVYGMSFIGIVASLDVHF